VKKSNGNSKMFFSIHVIDYMNQIINGDANDWADDKDKFDYNKKKLRKRRRKWDSDIQF
jgi:hypothetical protein